MVSDGSRTASEKSKDTSTGKDKSTYAPLAPVTENTARADAVSSAEKDSENQEKKDKAKRKRVRRGGTRHRGGKQLKKMEGTVAHVAHVLGELKV